MAPRREDEDEDEDDGDGEDGENGGDGEDVDRYGDSKNDDDAVVDGARSTSSPDASTSTSPPSSSSSSPGPPPRQIRHIRRQPGGGADVDGRPKNPRMQTFAFLNRPVVEVRIIGIVLLSCFLQAIDTLAGLPYEIHRGIGVIDTVCVYVFAVEFFLRWWSAGRFQLRYLSKPLVSIDAVRE